MRHPANKLLKTSASLGSDGRPLRNSLCGNEPPAAIESVLTFARPDLKTCGQKLDSLHCTAFLEIEALHASVDFKILLSCEFKLDGKRVKPFYSEQTLSFHPGEVADPIFSCFSVTVPPIH